MYGETAGFFSEEIKNRLVPDKEYVLADVGAFKGELLDNIISKLPDFKFKTVALDINNKALEENRADTKIAGVAEQLPFADKSVDVLMMRYVLQWNNPEKQKKIIKEIPRVIKDFALIEHIGSGNDDPILWRKNMDNLLGGDRVPKLKRAEQFFSSRDEIEKWMAEEGVKFERLNEQRIDNPSDAFIERYNLTLEEGKAVREILGDNDYEIKTDWIVYPD